MDNGGTANVGDDTSQPKQFTITVTPLADGISVTNATTSEDTQTTGPTGLVVTRNALDGPEVTHFKVTNIQNGALFLANGTTPVAAGSFVPFGAGGSTQLRFTPGANLNANILNGTAEFAVLPVSEILPVKGAELGGVFPSAVQTYIVMAAGVNVNARSSVAREFVAYLMAAPNSAVIRDKGMER